MKKWAIAAACLLLTGCGSTGDTDTPKPAESAQQAAVSLQSITVAPLEGQADSPDGRYTIRLEGHSEGVTAGGLYPSECIRIVDIKTGDVRWETDGGYTVACQWSHDGAYLALAVAGRTWEDLIVVKTEDFTALDVTLPDGSPFGEYSFVEQMAWEGDEYDQRLHFTLKDESGLRDYLCAVYNWYGQLSADTFSVTAEMLASAWDFTHDGVDEEVSLVTLTDPDGKTVSWYELWVTQAGQTLWRETFAADHAGYNTILACTLEDGDYLLRYHPYMGMGNGAYCYTLFTLDEAGQEVTAHENSVAFDVNFGSPTHTDFDAQAIAAFLQEVYGYLDGSTLLLSTEGGQLQRGLSGTDFFWQHNTLFRLPQDTGRWAQTLEDYAWAMSAGKQRASAS